MARMPGDDDAADLPDWLVPPRMIGGQVSRPAVIGRSGGQLVAVRWVLAFPAGIEVEVEANARGSAGGGTVPAAADAGGHPRLRFRVRFADGREAVQDDEAGLRSGRGPMLTVTGSLTIVGGPGDRLDMRLTLWIWPLPPPGPVTVTCSWPGRGLDDARLVLDGDQVQAAASLFFRRPGRPNGRLCREVSADGDCDRGLDHAGHAGVAAGAPLEGCPFPRARTAPSSPVTAFVSPASSSASLTFPSSALATAAVG